LLQSLCHDRQSRSLSLFGRRSAVDLTGLVVIADPLFIFHLLCLCLTHLVSIPQLLVHYLTLCFPMFVCDCLLYCGPNLCPCIYTTCIVIFFCKIAFITHLTRLISPATHIRFTHCLQPFSQYGGQDCTVRFKNFFKE
jgi:hypothetical protein